MSVNLVAVIGPTACGKTALAVRLAREINGEIISADSRQVYRGMDLGTGKDLSEYHREGRFVPYHLIDICEPEEEFHVFGYQRRFFDAFKDIQARGAFPIMVGGSGLYLDAVLLSYVMIEVKEDQSLRNELFLADVAILRQRLLCSRPDLHNTTDLLDRERLIRAIEIAESTAGPYAEPARQPEIVPLIIGIHMDAGLLREKITARLQERMDAGLIDEIKRLHEKGISWERIDRFGLEYRYVGLYLQGRIDKMEMFAKLNIRIHQFAKRQRTWFRRMEKRGAQIHWIPAGNYAALRELVFLHLDQRTEPVSG